MKFRPARRKFQLTLGQRGETLGWKFLRDQGYEILEKNYRCPHGEIDVIARKNRKIIFIEIKTRSGTGFGLPEEAVDIRKQRKMTRLAQQYLKEKLVKEASAGFEVLSILWDGISEPEFRLIEEAFDAAGSGGEEV